MLVRAMPWLGKASAMPAAVRPARHPARYLGHQPAIDEVRNRLSQDSPRTSIRSLRPEYVLLATLLATHPRHRAAVSISPHASLRQRLRSPRAPRTGTPREFSSSL